MARSQYNAHTYEIASGETLAFDLRNVIPGWSYVVRVPSGTTVRRRVSNGNRPGNKYVSPPQRASSTQSFFNVDDIPFGWLQLSAASGPASLDVVSIGSASIRTHSSVDDTISALAVGAQAITVGDAPAEFAEEELWNYPKGSVDTTAVSSAPAVATVAVDPNTGRVAVQAVSAGTATITLTGTTPAENTATIALAFTVSA